MPYFVGEKTDDNMNGIPESLSSTAFPAEDEYDEQEIPRKKQKRSFSPAIEPSSNEPASTLKKVSQDKKVHGSGSMIESSGIINNAHNKSRLDNITDHEPQIGMHIDFRDLDFIWSSATIVAIHQPTVVAIHQPSAASSTLSNATTTESEELTAHDGRLSVYPDKPLNVAPTPLPVLTSLSVTVRYDGWSAQYDEIAEWYNSPRIAKVLTYTRRVKCFARLLPSKAKKGSQSTKLKDSMDLWPCKVLFRMPHPDDRHRTHIAEELLRLERNICVQPYGFEEDLLPQALSKIFTPDFKTGRWISTSSLLGWESKARASDFGLVQDNFSKAMKLALADKSTPGFLPKGSVFEKNSLLVQTYRVQSTVDAESATPLTGELISTSNHEVEIVGTVHAPSNSSQKPAPRKYSTHFFPGGLNIPEQPSFFKSQEIFPTSDNPEKFSVRVKVAENDLFVGEYPTKSTAVEALKLCLGTHPDRQTPSDVVNQVIHDIHTITPEAVIAVWKKSTVKDKKSNFSPKEWAKAYIEKSTQEPSKWEDPLKRAFL